MERIQAAILKAKQKREISALGSQEASSQSRSKESTDVWQSLSKFNIDLERMDAKRIVTFSQSDPSHFNFDLMRSKLLRVLRENNWTTVGFTSAAQRSGKSMICLNLAFSLAHQQASRTVVCDLDLRQPQISDVLGVRGERSIDSFLKGHSSIEEVFKCYGSGLAVGFCNQAAEDPAELLQSESAEAAMKSIRNKLNPDVILVDLPPLLVADDVMSFIKNLDGVFLVAAAEETTLEAMETCVGELAEHTNVLGVILNKCRYISSESGPYLGYY